MSQFSDIKHFTFLVCQYSENDLKHKYDEVRELQQMCGNDTADRQQEKKNNTIEMNLLYWIIHLLQLNEFRVFPFDLCVHDEWKQIDEREIANKTQEQQEPAKQYNWPSQPSQRTERVSVSNKTKFPKHTNKYGRGTVLFCLFVYLNTNWTCFLGIIRAARFWLLFFSAWLVTCELAVPIKYHHYVNIWIYYDWSYELEMTLHWNRTNS